MKMSKNNQETTNVNKNTLIQKSYVQCNLPNVQFVILTKKQFETLGYIFGYDIIYLAIKTLDNWLKFDNKNGKKYIGKNHFSHFRANSWSINEARYVLNLINRFNPTGELSL